MLWNKFVYCLDGLKGFDGPYRKKIMNFFTIIYDLNIYFSLLFMINGYP